MPDPDTPASSSIALGPRLARLVGTGPDAAAKHVLLRPVLPGVPAVEDRLPEPDPPALRRSEGTDATPAERGLSHGRSIGKEMPDASEKLPETRHPVAAALKADPDAVPDPARRGEDTAPAREGIAEPPVAESHDRSAPRPPPVVCPAPLIDRILRDSTDSPPTIQPKPSATPAPSEQIPSEAAQRSGGAPDTPAKPLVMTARDRIFERIIQAPERDGRPRPEKAPDASGPAQEAPDSILPARPVSGELASVAERPNEAKDNPPAPDSPRPGAQPQPPQQPAPQPDPLQPREPVKPSPPKPLTAKQPEPKPPVRVEIGALNITLRQPDPPRARPALSITRKAPRAHSIPLRGFGED